MEVDDKKENKINENKNIERCNGSFLKFSHEGIIFQIIASILCGGVHFGLGVMLAYPGITLTQLTQNTTTHEPILDPIQATLFTSISNGGLLIGAILVGPCLIWFGQRRTILIMMPFIFIAYMVLYLSSGAMLILAARVFHGIPMGVIAEASVSYLVEVSEEHIRGRLMAMIDLWRMLGIVFVYLVGSSSLGWREVALLCGCITTFPIFIAFLFLPDSFRWLVSKNNVEQAALSLNFYQRKKDNDSKTILKSIKDELAYNKSTVKSQLQTVYRDKQILKRVMTLCGLIFMLQFTGNITVISYSTVIFQSLGNGINGYAGSIIIGLMKVIAAIVFICIVDKIGRRKVFIATFGLSGVSLFLLGLCFIIEYYKYDSTIISWFSAISLFIFMFMITLTEPILSVYRPELLPNSVRSLGMSLTIMLNFLTAFIATQTFPLMVESGLGSHGTFWCYGVVCGLCAMFIWVFIPETKGKTLEAIGQEV